MIQVFDIVRSFIFDFNVVVFAVDANKSIIKSTKNIDYFDFEYENSFDTNSFIVTFDRHTFYRDVFIFTNRLKKLKKKFFDSKIKKYVSICLKSDAFRKHVNEFNSLKKIFFYEMLLLINDVLF